jgi:arginyl-tRNA synthetase
VASYLIELASTLGKFLNRHRVIDSTPEIRAARLALVASVGKVLSQGLTLLGISAPEEM